MKRMMYNTTAFRLAALLAAVAALGAPRKW